jgi:hypothetical protein
MGAIVQMLVGGGGSSPAPPAPPLPPPPAPTLSSVSQTQDAAKAAELADAGGASKFVMGGASTIHAGLGPDTGKQLKRRFLGAM